MSGWGWFMLIIIILIPISYFGFIFYRRFQAQKQGLPPPPFNPFNRSDPGASRIYPAPSGIIGWAKNKYHSIRGSSSRSGAYEPTTSGGQRGLDSDEAWDARVGAESDSYGPGGYYEEQELGLRPPPADSYGGGYGNDGTSYGVDDTNRGRSLSRDDTAYIGGGISRDRRPADLHPSERENPFGDAAEASSMIGVSPRPHEEVGHDKKDSNGESLKAESPTERRSMFREETM